MNKDRVSVVILQWDHAEDTIRCLESLLRSSYPITHVIVVDNGSSAEQLSLLRRWTWQQAGQEVLDDNDRWASWCHVYDGEDSLERHDTNWSGETWGHGVSTLPFPLILIRLGVNRGFAEGNNIGIRVALREGQATFVWILNNDTEVEADALHQMVIALQKDDSLGAVQSLLLREHDRAHIDSLGIGLSATQSVYDLCQGEERSTVAGETQEVFGVCAASALYRASVLRTVGLFDPGYFAIFEDADLAFRLRFASWRAGLVPSAVVYHKRGVSGRKERAKESFQMLLLKQRNAVALKLRYWPVRFLLWPPPGLFAVLLKAALRALRKGELRDTLIFWMRSLQHRSGQYELREAVFTRWIREPGICHGVTPRPAKNLS